MLIPFGVFGNEVEVEQRIIVYELVGRILHFLADGCKLADKTTLLQLLECLGKFRIVCQSGCIQ